MIFYKNHMRCSRPRSVIGFVHYMCLLPGFSASAPLTFFVVGCPVHGRMFSCNPGLYPLDARSTAHAAWQPSMSPDFATLLLEGIQLPLVENHRLHPIHKQLCGCHPGKWRWKQFSTVFLTSFAIASSWRMQGVGKRTGRQVLLVECWYKYWGGGGQLLDSIQTKNAHFQWPRPLSVSTQQKSWHFYKRKRLNDVCSKMTW